MVQYHKAFKTKLGGAGGKKRTSRDKRKAHWGGFFSRTKYEKTDEKEARQAFKTKGGRYKTAAVRVLYANVSDGKTVKKTKITNVAQTPDNRHFARENLITKGAIIETELGKAKVSSRPGQNGIINAVLIK